MAPCHIRKYQESDRQGVLHLFSQGIPEYFPKAFRHVLKLPRTLVLLILGPLTLFVVSGSWLLALVASLTLLAALRFLAKYPLTEFEALCLHTDMADITRSYFGDCGSCFWVVESEGQVVGMVGALPVKKPSLQKEQVQLLHLNVAQEHRGQGLGKALVRTVLQFAQEQGYSEVILSTTVLQPSALALYRSMGFQKVGQYFFSSGWRLIAVPAFQFRYCLPSARVAQAQKQGGVL
ncbi:hypothetical protein MC885_000875 [Smutsia gigantea]|nr:hypothetical protein MC885_000875 [Smutsia gigantea]